MGALWGGFAATAVIAVWLKRRDPGSVEPLNTEIRGREVERPTTRRSEHPGRLQALARAARAPSTSRIPPSGVPQLNGFTCLEVCGVILSRNLGYPLA